MDTGSDTKTSKCLRCGRTRHFRSATAATAAKPYGRICRAKIRAAAIAQVVKGFKDAQVEKARELISDGGLVPLRRGIFRAVSSDGERTYLTASTGQCNCAAGLRGKYRCFHGLAAMIVTASKGA
jgi:hypothetical protein